MIRNSRKEIPLKLEAYFLNVLHCELNSCIKQRETLNTHINQQHRRLTCAALTEYKVPSTPLV